MNDLQEYFNHNKNRQINKWDHYFDIYDKHFNRFRNQEVIIVEIGIFQGGSLQMWKKYFGARARIFGIDINPECKNLEEDNIKIFIGSQSDDGFLEKLKDHIPPIDILIDDGGHTMIQQLITFKTLFKHIKPVGIYLCEDLHTSYWLEYGGGFKRQGTFIEFAKTLVDSLNAFHSEQSAYQPDEYTRSINSLHFYDSILVIEKSTRHKPLEISSGGESFDDNAYKEIRKKTSWRIKYGILYSMNTILRFFRLKGYKWR